ncbi:helix-turn-helix domain-containing protein [Streptococcus infantarius]|uniref:helix-turn-helix domain-containing protein n=1 Tax=Streptococcus infantarius TaxID=102684 RepID=UPI003D1004EC
MNRLKELRKEKKYTQAQIAELMDVNVKTISRWERGEFEIKPAQAKMLADFFGVSVGYLLGYDDNDFEKQIRIDTLNDILGKLHAAHISQFETTNPEHFSAHFWAGFEAAGLIVQTQKILLDFEEEN